MIHLFYVVAWMSSPFNRKARLWVKGRKGLFQKIQAEITQLQGQISSIAESASFSGENWLSVDSGAVGYNAAKSIVAISLSVNSAV